PLNRQVVRWLTITRGKRRLVMKPNRFHLAQANIARMRAPLDSPIMEGFRSQLQRINATADSSPGFVWRLQTGERNATAIRAYEDDRILLNMSGWEALEALRDYVYRSDHAGALRIRREWCEPRDGPILVLCWILADHIPCIDD